jgi:uncharacterized paraquat-inducible protein A
MAYCPNCGATIHDEAVRCVHCNTNIYQPKTAIGSSIRDEGGFLWGLLGFAVPIAGLIIYLLWKEDHPLNAKAAGTGALVYVGLMVAVFLVYILMVIFIIGVAA